MVTYPWWNLNKTMLMKRHYDKEDKSFVSSDAMWGHETCSTPFPAMACCVVALSHHHQPKLPYLIWRRRVAVHTFVTLPNPKHWLMIHVFDLMMKIRWTKATFTIMESEVVKLEIFSSIYSIKWHWGNGLTFRHTIEKCTCQAIYNCSVSDKSA